jgi:hypothetical protein
LAFDIQYTVASIKRHRIADSADEYTFKKIDGRLRSNRFRNDVYASLQIAFGTNKFHGSSFSV